MLLRKKLVPAGIHEKDNSDSIPESVANDGAPEQTVCGTGEEEIYTTGSAGVHGREYDYD
jgi:hypothetical protein